MQRRMIGLLAVLTLLCAFSAAMAEPFNFAPRVTEAPAQTPLVQATQMPVVDGIPYSLGISAFPAERGESRKVLLSFLGDCTLGCNEIDHGKKKSLDYYIGEFGFGYCFEQVRYILDRDDLTVGNLECVLADTPDGLDARTKKTYNFRAYESYVNILKEGSVEAVTVANNHIGDYGQPGFDATVRVLCENGVSWFGSTDWGGQFYIYEQDGVRIGLVGSHVSFYWQNVDQMKAVFDHLREENCQVIIAVIHAGVEYDKRHDDNQTKMAKRFTKALVDKSVKAQRALLGKALALVRPGGTVVYSTCSVLACENEDVVSWSLGHAGKGRTFELAPIELPGADDLPTLPAALEGTITLRPTDRYEGFFVAKITRK